MSFSLPDDRSPSSGRAGLWLKAGILALALALAAACAEQEKSPDADATLPDHGGPERLLSDLAAVEILLPDAPLTDGQRPDIGQVSPLAWVAISPGVFTMGSPASEPCREPDNSAKETQHTVTLTRSFELSATEVTQAQFYSRMWYNPSKNASCGLSCPVEMVSWNEAAAFCNLLSAEKGLVACYACTGNGKGSVCKEAAAYSGAKIYTCPGYRLPTEAEWELAYRDKSTTALYNGTLTSCTSSDANADAIAWYKKSSGGTSHPVGQKTPNTRGLYDLSGNVWEWCHDWHDKDLGSAAATDPWGSAVSWYYRLIRGGSWFGYSYNLRAARRFCKEPTYRCHGIGFRVARTLPAAPSPDGGGGQ